MTADQQTKFETWVSTRPEAVQVVARKYPPGTKFLMHGKIMHVISFNENGTVCVTDIDPSVDYRRAVEQREPICQCCVGELDSIIVT